MKILLLASAGIALSPGLLRAQSGPKFEVASIRPCQPTPDSPDRRGGGVGVSPGRLSVTCMPLMFLIQGAYVAFANETVRPFDSVPISGGPAWINSDRYDIEAKAEGTPSRQMMQGPMVQALLEDRFKLKIHRETKEIPVYELTVARSGFKLQPMQEGDCTPPDARKPPDLTKTPAELAAVLSQTCGVTRTGGGQGQGKLAFAEFRGMSLDEICGNLIRLLDRPVINKTGIAGMFRVRLEFAPDEATPRFFRSNAPGAAVEDPPGGPSIFTAFQEQLGLKLEPAKGFGEFLVIDSVSRPSEN
jgi:uncharacterized protein (TIGR03435 family)